MAEFELEPGETERLRHAPGWVDLLIVAAILLIELAIVLTAAQEIATRPTHDRQVTLAAIIVMALFVGAVLQFAVLAMPPLLQITDRRIALRRRLGWDEPETLRLEDIDAVRQQGWRMRIAGGGQTLSVFCPPPFAARIRRAIEGGANSIP
ncbi:MAG: hypothetical protein JSU82_16870 [Rhodospirillales bacterium]|nr:MAG: hypothetical protein JSU82_16870 [Rhodospirillales bacterium]